MSVPEHLGGFVPEGDEATFFPELWNWCVNVLGVASVLDIGCGAGISTRHFRNRGIIGDGIDGVDTGLTDIIVHDFTTAAYVPSRRYDLAWMCEFVEHVEEPYISNVVPALQSCDLVLMTHAFPGQAGHHHVNLKPPEYWKGFMAAAGFTDAGFTKLARRFAESNLSPWNHFTRSGLAFRRI